MSDDLRKFTVLDEKGQELEGEILSSFYLEELDKDYVVYTFNEEDSKGLIVMYVSIVTPEGMQSIQDDHEWDLVKQEIKELVG